MTKVLSEVTRDALDLPLAERRTLARILLDNTDSDQDFSPEVAAAWEDEIARRLHAVEEGTARSRPAAEVFSDLDRRFA
jgi:hypothetical protein